MSLTMCQVYLLTSRIGFILHVHVVPTSNSFWALATDALPPRESAALAEDLGIESDTPEHSTVEKGPLCAPQGSVLGKRRR